MEVWKKAFTKTLLSVLYLQHFSEFTIGAVYPFNLVSTSSQNTSPIWISMKIPVLVKLKMCNDETKRASIFETPSKNSFFQDFWHISEGHKMLISQKENEGKIFQQTIFLFFFFSFFKKQSRKTNTIFSHLLSTIIGFGLTSVKSVS